MKIAEPIQGDNIEIVRSKEEIRQVKFLGALIPKPGQSCWQLEVATGIVTPAEVDAVNVTYGADIKVKAKITVKPGHLYLTAINKENAERKFIKMLIKYLKK